MEYGAIDLHTRESQIRIVTAEGQVVFERRVPTRRDRLTEVFGGRPAMRILLESGTESEWVAQHLEGLGHEVVVADPNYAAMYGERTRRIKTDRRDVAALGEANRRGIYRPAHRVSRTQREVRRQLQVRDQCIRMRTQAINLLRAQLRSEGPPAPLRGSAHGGGALRGAGCAAGRAADARAAARAPREPGAADRRGPSAGKPSGRGGTDHGAPHKGAGRGADHRAELPRHAR